MKARCYRLVIVSVGLLLCDASVFGQQSGVAAIAPDDPELYFGFFSFHQAIQKDISGAKDASSGAAFLRAAADHFNISESDFLSAGRVISSVLGRISALMQAAKAYSSNEMAAGRRPDRTTLEAFQKQRLELLRDGANDLQQAVSPTGWEALHSYINGPYRSHTIRKELTRAK
jgi:hypothetical protein